MTIVRYRASHLLTMNGTPNVVVDGVVDLDGDTVSWSGPDADAPDHTGPVERLDGLLMPGFVNTHAHSPMVLFRGAGEGLAVDRWLIEVMWPREGRLGPDDVWWGMTLGAAELLTNGITTSHETYFLGDQMAAAADEAGMRTVITPPLLIGPDLARFGTWEEQLAGVADLAAAYRGHERITVGLGPHAAYSLPEEALQAVTATALEVDTHIHIHVAEGEHEGDGIMERHGMTVPRYLESLGLLEARVVAAHGVWLTRDDIDLFSRHEVGVAHCPMSNGRHASGFAPVVELRAAGVPVGVATDGPASDDRLDLFEGMRAGLRLARLRHRDAGVLGPADMLTMATREAGLVLGRPDLGHLGPGAKADMVLVGTDSLGPVVDPDDIVTHLVYSGSPGLIEQVWVGGEIVVHDGHPEGVDMSKARSEVEQRARRLAAAQ